MEKAITYKRDLNGNWGVYKNADRIGTYCWIKSYERGGVSRVHAWYRNDITGERVDCSHYSYVQDLKRDIASTYAVQGEQS